MSLYEILRIVFAVIICLPILALGAFLFGRIAGYIINIDSNRRRRRQAVLDEQERRRRFDLEYRRTHGDLRR